MQPVIYIPGVSTPACVRDSVLLLGRPGKGWTSASKPKLQVAINTMGRARQGDCNCPLLRVIGSTCRNIEMASNVLTVMGVCEGGV